MLAALMLLEESSKAQFTVGGNARVNANDFEITTFATGLNFPLGMTLLPDSSLLAAVSSGSSFDGSTSGSLIRFVDNNDDGIADQQILLRQNIPYGRLTAVRAAGKLVFVTGQARPITIYRLGLTLSDTLTEIGKMTITYTGSWLHLHSTLALRPTPSVSNSFDLFFQLGSSANFAKTTATLQFSSTRGPGGILHGDAVYMVRVVDYGDSVSTSEPTQIATGLRNAAGMAFHPETGDLYIQDNGIDGLTDPNEPLSADELNIIPADSIGGSVEDFGFPNNYVAYRSGEFVGGQGIPPLVVFQPIPDPLTGAESEGPNDIAFAPPDFPSGLRKGIFIGFHGRYSLGGLANEENPLVYVDLDSLKYFHFIGVDQPAIGHLDGVLATRHSLFLADISPGGSLGTSGANTGVIYRIRKKEVAQNVASTGAELPSSFMLLKAFPNPFNPSTEIQFSLPYRSHVTLTIFDLLGQEVMTLVSEELSAGSYSTRWDAVGFPSGVYLYRLTTDSFVETKKLVLIR